MRKGGGRNERKVNERRAEQAKEKVKTLRAQLRALKRLTVQERPSNYPEELRMLSGMLKQLLRKQEKSETHSRRPKGGG